MNQASSPAAQLKPHQRQKIALRVLTKKETISSIAEEERVSRKFLYKQGYIAQNALTLAFEKPKSDQKVLFYLPVTQKWLSQLILALILICHSSYRGVVELLRDLFDYSISIGTVHNQVGEAVQKARKINQSEDLSPIEASLLFGNLSGKFSRVSRSGCSFYLLFPPRGGGTQRRGHLGLLSTRSRRTGAEP